MKFNLNMINQQFNENWLNREIKSIIKEVDLALVCINFTYYPRSGRNSLLEPNADLIVKKVLDYNEKINFLLLKYFFNYPKSQLSQLIINYACIKAITRSLKNLK